MKNPQLTYIRLPLEGAKNVRELGGYPTGDGAPTKWRSFLRSDSLSGLTDSDITFLYDYGVRTVVDLRSDEETANSPNPALHHPNLAYHHISLADEGNLKKATELSITLKELYLSTLRHPQTVGRVLKVLAHSEGCSLFHCTAGKDRTGIISMLLLSLAGVSAQDIMANYQVSHTYIRSGLSFPAGFAEQHPQLMSLFDSPADNIQAALESLETEHGGAETYVRTCGLTEEEVALLKDKLM